MPFIGRIPFLPIHEWIAIPRGEEDVSMPFIGRIPFLRDAGLVPDARRHQCQCPSSGESHFYEMPGWYLMPDVISVNALHRANPISTPFF